MMEKIISLGYYSEGHNDIIITQIILLFIRSRSGEVEVTISLNNAGSIDKSE
jgi:hypothetical protein